MINDVQNLKKNSSQQAAAADTTTQTISIIRLNKAESAAAEQGAAGRLVAVHQQGGASQPHDLDSTNFISQPLSPCHRGNFENSPSNLHYIIINVKCYGILYCIFCLQMLINGKIWVNVSVSEVDIIVDVGN